MKAALLVLALLLMLTAIVSSLWVDAPRLPFPHRYSRHYVKGRVTGDFSDHPWSGTVAYFDGEKTALRDDGIFSFAASPGTHILKVCCSERFRWIYREVAVVDRDLDLELRAEPLIAVPGRVIVSGEGVKLSGYKVSAWLVGTNVVEAAITLADGTFALHLIEGNWEFAIDNPPKGQKVESMTLGEEKLQDKRFTLTNLESLSLPLRIELR